MKQIFLFFIISFLLTACGYKAPPTPIFPPGKNQIDSEVYRRNKNYQEPTLQPLQENPSL